MVTEAGEKVHVAWVGAPEQLSDTVPVNPPSGATVRVKVVEAPAPDRVRDVGAAETEKSMPVPDRVTDCGLPPAAGLNVTLIVHCDPIFTLEPQLLVWVKSPLVAMF